MMKKVLCLALVGSLMCAVGANAQTTVTLELKSDTVDEYWIEATITGGDLSEGLALWGADVNFTAGGPPGQMSCPAGMLSFQVNDGLNNPAGYGGTLSGTILLQVGGAQNTINNDVGNAPYPIGAVVLGIGTPMEIVATGDCVDTVDIMTLENGFANVIDENEVGPVYAVSAATIILVGTDVVCGGSGGPSPNFTAVESIGDHTSYGDLPITVDWTGGVNNSEPRQREAHSARLTVEVTFDADIALDTYALDDASGPEVSPAITGAVATADGTANVVISFPSALPNDEACYMFDLVDMLPVSGSAFGSGGEDTDFCLCYVEADVDGLDRFVGVGDNFKVIDTYWTGDPSSVEGATRADIDRDGNIGVGDNFLVIDTNWSHGSPAGSLVCP